MGRHFPRGKARIQFQEVERVSDVGATVKFRPQDLPELCRKIFCKDGYISILPNFEYRAQQEEMAVCCAQTFASGLPLIFEAGTGVGKSLAYLVGGIIAAKRFNKKLVIATNTISLQQQIVEKDLPRIRLLFENCDALADCADFAQAILIGRGNYLCTTRLKRAIADKKELFDTEEAAELGRIAEWAKTTKTGIRDELSPEPDPEVWSWVCADSSTCTPRTCDDTCFYQEARRRVAGADIVILNHSLLFSLIAGGERGGDSVLFENDMIVLDEAHLVPDVASNIFGLSLSNTGLMRTLRRIYNPKTKKGLITRVRMAEYFDKKLISDTMACVEDFFASVMASRLQKRDIARLGEPNWGEDLILNRLEEVEQTLKRFAQNALTERNAAEINDYKDDVRSLRLALESCIYLTEPGNVYWLECARKTNKVSVNSAPIDVSKILRKVLFESSSPVIMTSATMAVNGSMDDFISKTGAEAAQWQIATSPFDYKKNMRVFYAVDAPAFDKGASSDADALCQCIEKLCFLVRGGTLILFSSHYELKKTAALLKKSDLLKGRMILAQNEDGRRGALLQKFASAGNAILLGADSFWTGVDVPGEALSQVIITKLPFENFSNPLTEARCERVDDTGGSGFMSVMLPNAVIKFRQGAGRLIRTNKDKGDIVILDSRVASKGYGKYFLNSLPVPARRFRIGGVEEIMPELEELGIV